MAMSVRGGQGDIAKKQLLFDPSAGPRDLPEQVVTRVAGVVSGQQCPQPGLFVGAEISSAFDVPSVERHAHGHGLDGQPGAAGQAAQDEHAAAIEVTGVHKADPSALVPTQEAPDQAQQGDHGPVALPRARR